MGFLDDIQRRSPALGQPTAPPPLLKDPSPEADSSNVVRVARYEDTKQSTGSRNAVTWVGILIMLLVLPLGIWKGLQRFEASAGAGETAASGDAAPAPTAAASAASRPARFTPRSSAAARGRRATARKTVATIAPVIPLDVTADAGVASVDAVTESGVPAVETAPAVVEPDLANDFADDGIYSDASAGVVPPRLVSLGFVGRLVNGFQARTSSMELLISKDGTVERAKLFVPSYNMQDAMLLSRAKNLVFVPASKEGFPVRYRFVLEVDATP